MSGSHFEDLISGRKPGLTAGTQRAGLAMLSKLYTIGVQWRNRRYDGGQGVRPLSVPVVSVGNITVGGTGKTPMTLWVCELLRHAGFHPAVVSRGYKRTAGQPADEVVMLQRRCPGLVVITDPDRFRGGQMAIREHGVNVVVMDDGFQHRRLARDLDIVLMDATCPFGYEAVLPRGLLREPLSSLRRADVFVITRSDQADPAELDALQKRLGELAPGKPIVRAVHRPSGFVSLQGEPVEATMPLERPVAFAAIARPAAFERTLRSMGLTLISSRWFGDHHAYGGRDLEALAKWAQREKADAVITTEKDAVKIAAMPVAWPCPAYALRVDIAFAEAGDTIMTRLIHEAVDVQ